MTASVSYALVVGHAGVTYSIAERDAATELKEKLAQIDWKKKLANIKPQVRDFQPPDIAYLPRARRDRSFLVDPTYTLSHDIPDGKGGILYPKGYTFNPLDYVSLPGVLVIIDGRDKKQIEWFQKSPYAALANVEIYLTGGSYRELSERLQRPVFYATKQIVKRLKLAAVPSVVYQKGKYLEVNEFEISRSK